MTNNTMKVLPVAETFHSGNARKFTDKCQGYLTLNGKTIWRGTEFEGVGCGVKAYNEAKAEAAKY